MAEKSPLQELHSTKRVLLDSVLLGVVVGLLLSGLAVVLLGVYALGAAIL